MTMRSRDTKSPETTAESRTLWNRAAVRYAGDQSSVGAFHRSIYMPVMDAMIGDVHKKRVLDAGCGDGEYTRKLACSGAIVTGIDGSREMIRLARKDPIHPSIRYAVMDLTRSLPIQSRSMDMIVGNMVLMDLPEIETCINEFSRILRDGGLFVFSITHPAFFCSDWAGDASGPRSYKIVLDYLNEKTEPLNFWGETLHYHRPISAYFNTLEKYGMCVLSLEEPVPDVNEEEMDPYVLSHLRIPSFLVIKAALRE